ncbi:acyltransferase domain-containing protein [Streptomyces sp. NBC_00124]|uniref:beta-ketoacyl synthase N-terminal-like domain-containing protein n=1 Tax=Streptomyces sp. NBC_00124 TaxID=2975662 RepID=UPI002254066C|nr:beta-ketoacyl synthase N-terminal-like domain-containing protein [Streptomyces sp. NBC_00124]MCX5366433.1 acyltransferase domain-containing protein [Streptomyces sp. NBC_00124]
MRGASEREANLRRLVAEGEGEERALRRLIAEKVAAWSGIAVGDVPMDQPLADLGMASRDAVVLAGELSRATGLDLPATLLWEASTGDALVARVRGAAADIAPAEGAASRHTAPAPEPGEPIAVVGIGCRLPGGVHGPDEYWRLLREGVDAIRRVPEDRWRDFTPYPPADALPYGGYLDDIAGFDADFFRITPREAAVMDPQQRILLEVVQETLDHAAVPAASLAGTATGVFVGVSAPEYGQLTGADPEAVDPWAPAGGALSVAAGRLSYVLDTRGPSMAVDTACSSSLVAVHHACVSLRTGESDRAIAAGVNLLLSPTVTVAFRRAGALAPDGRCKPFSAAADGIGRGEGCAAVLLKRLSDAERDGDRVLAVIRATAVNSDGRSNGLLAPNPAAQQALLTTAYVRAGLAPARIDHVEAHGTGTPLGDPIEAGALGAVLGTGRDPDQPLLLGSVKGNLGHLESAAGIAGLVKTVLALHHDLIPPSLHCAEGSALDDDVRLRVVTEAEPWPRYGGTATAGVSGFGFGGTNAHAVLEEWRPGALLPLPADEPPARLHLLSDADTARVRDTAGRLADWLGTPEAAATHPADLARTLAGRTGRGSVRAAIVAGDRAELADGLGALAAGRPHARVMTGDLDLVGRGPVWVFSGYGSQWAGMGRRLLDEEPDFAAAVEKLDAQLAPECGFSLCDHLASGGDLDRLEVAQPVLFGVQLALAELWRAHGVEPVAVIGHSLGEVAAAVCAGALEVSDAARVVAVRARLLSGLRGGAMAVVDLDDGELDALERDFPGVHVAVHSSPRQKVVTGEEAAVARLVRRLEGEGRAARAMRVVGAGHSPQVEPLLAELADSLADIRGGRPRIPVYSTVLDDPRGDCVFDSAHWIANLRRPVRLDQAVAAAAADGHTAFVELSPHPVLTRAITDNAPGALALGTLHRGADTSADFLTQLGTLHTAGLRLPLPPGRVTDLPLPRWRHVRHWWTDGRAGGSATGPARTRSAGGHLSQRDRVAPEAGGHLAERGRVAEDASVSDRLCHHIAAVTGHPPTRITPTTAFAELGLDSLMAVRIRTALEREFDIELPLRDLLGATTVEDTATRIQQALPGNASAAEDVQAPPPKPTSEHSPLPPLLTSDPHPPLHPLHLTGSHPPLFLVHAAGGTTDVYRHLVERLGGQRPVYGLERLAEVRSVGEKARRYAEAVAAAHPDGPCLLGGWSFGGFVAQEAARQLSAAGRDVELVVLIDSVRPLPRREDTEADRIRAHFTGFARHVAETYGVQLRLPYDELVATQDDGERIDTVLRALREAADVPRAALEHQRSSYLDLRIGEAHRPGRYDRPVVLYRATEPAPHTVRDPAYERDDASLGWDEVCPDLSVVRVTGHHLSLLDPPHVDEIAAHLRWELAKDRR